MTKRGTAILLTAAMLCLCAAQVCAKPENATGASAEIQTSSGAGYTEYISGREELIGKGEAVILQGETADTENAEYLSDEHVYRKCGIRTPCCNPPSISFKVTIRSSPE